MPVGTVMVYALPPMDVLPLGHKLSISAYSEYTILTSVGMRTLQGDRSPPMSFNSLVCPTDNNSCSNVPLQPILNPNVTPEKLRERYGFGVFADATIRRRRRSDHLSNISDDNVRQNATQLRASNTSYTVQAIMMFDDWFNQTDLDTFEHKLFPSIGEGRAGAVTVKGDSTGTNRELLPSGESNLDIQYIRVTGYGVQTEAWGIMNITARGIPGVHHDHVGQNSYSVSFIEAFEYLVGLMLSAQPSPPAVVSISYG
jgi:hypothetical protein